MQDIPLETALVAYAPDAVIFADCEGIIRFWNAQAEVVFGYSAAEAVGTTLDLIVPEPARKAHWAGFHRAVQRGRFAKDTALQTSRAFTKDGKTIFVELSAAVVWNGSGQVRGIMAIGRDVTARRIHEQTQRELVARLEDQLAALTQDAAKASNSNV